MQEVNSFICAGDGGSVAQCERDSVDVCSEGNEAACGGHSGCVRVWVPGGDVDALQAAVGVPDYGEGDAALVHDKDGRSQ